MSNYGAYPGKYPAFIRDYDKASRLCRVEIPGITDGHDVLPLAEILYPVGEKSFSSAGQGATEIEILANDPVWVEFIGGDERRPLICGYRNPTLASANSVDYRRIRHANVEITASSGDLKLNAAEAEINLTSKTMKATCDSISVDGNMTINGDVTINGATLSSDSIWSD